MTDKPQRTFPPLPTRDDIALIFWDLGDVLVTLDYEALFGAVCPLLDTTPKAFHQALFSTGIFAKANRGETTPEVFHQETLEALQCQERGCDLSFAAFRAAWVQFFQPRPGMGALLKALEGRVEQWLLSNTDPMHHQACQEAYPYLDTLTGQLTSYGLGAMKPDALIYERALAHVSQEAERTMFFDDKPENIEGARALGIHAYLYTTEEACQAELARYGLLEEKTA